MQVTLIFTWCSLFSTSTVKSASSFKRKNKLALFTAKIDKDQSITKKMGATITPEVVITGADDSVLYRGRINDAYLEPGKKKTYLYQKRPGHCPGNYNQRQRSTKALEAGNRLLYHQRK